MVTPNASPLRFVKSSGTVSDHNGHCVGAQGSLRRALRRLRARGAHAGTTAMMMRMPPSWRRALMLALAAASRSWLNRKLHETAHRSAESLSYKSCTVKVTVCVSTLGSAVPPQGHASCNVQANPGKTHQVSKQAQPNTPVTCSQPGRKEWAERLVCLLLPPHLSPRPSSSSLSTPRLHLGTPRIQNNP